MHVMQLTISFLLPSEVAANVPFSFIFPFQPFPANMPFFACSCAGAPFFSVSTFLTSLALHQTLA